MMRILTSFLGFVLAIMVSIFIFAPERIPAGYGFQPVPVELTVENSLAGQLVESVTGKSGKNVVLKNTSSSPLNNLTVTLRAEDKTIKHQYIQPVMPAAQQITLGWVRNWEIEAGDELEVKASTYYKVVWTL